MENKIREYYLRGSEMFNIKSTSTLRDGGTIIVETSTKVYYLDRLSYSVHTSYPTRLENMVDEPLFYYFLDRLKRYYVNIDIEANLIGKIINHHKVNDEKIV